MGGSSQTTEHSYDPLSSFMSAYTAMKSDQRSQEAWDIYRDQFLVPLSPKLANAQALGMDEAAYDIQANRPLRDQLRQQQMAELTQSAPVMEKFYTEALKGIDPQYEAKMGAATADVAQAYSGAAQDTAMQLGRMGVDPNSGRAVAALNGLGQARARDTAYARTAARENERARVEDTNFARLQAGAAARVNATRGQWAPDYGAAAVSGGLGGQVGQSATQSVQYQQLAQSGWNALANRQMSSTTSTNDGGAGIAQIGASLAGGAIAKWG